MDAATSCVNIRDLFYSQARAAAAITRRGRSSMDSEINTERLATLMAAFENGDVFRPNPFDVDDPIGFSETKACAMVTAFAELARRDTPIAEGVSIEDHEAALVVAGLLQGMWIGFEYAHREVYGEKSC